MLKHTTATCAFKDSGFKWSFKPLLVGIADSKQSGDYTKVQDVLIFIIMPLEWSNSTQILFYELYINEQ